MPLTGPITRDFGLQEPWSGWLLRLPVLTLPGGTTTITYLTCHSCYGKCPERRGPADHRLRSLGAARRSRVTSRYGCVRHQAVPDLSGQLSGLCWAEPGQDLAGAGEGALVLEHVVYVAADEHRLVRLRELDAAEPRAAQQRACPAGAGQGESRIRPRPLAQAEYRRGLGEPDVENVLPVLDLRDTGKSPACWSRPRRPGRPANGRGTRAPAAAVPGVPSPGGHGTRADPGNRPRRAFSCDRRAEVQKSVS